MSCLWELAGYAASWPWLMILSCFGLFVHVLHILIKSLNGTLSNMSKGWHIFEIIFDTLLMLNSVSPFLTFERLYDTRTTCNRALRPLLASRAIGTGVHIEVIGEPDDPIAHNLWVFTKLIGHGFREMTQPNWSQCILLPEQDFTAPASPTAAAAAAADTTTEPPAPAAFKAGTNGADLRVRVHVMSTIEHRDAIFDAVGGDLGCVAAMDPHRSVFLWSGKEDPFTNDEIGRRMMKYLCV
jgi:hypothetical protein